MLPPHQPSKRKKIERSRPIPSARAARPADTEAADSAEAPTRPTLRILGRAAAPSRVAAARVRRTEKC